MIIKESALPKGLPKETQSLCPECKKIIDATIFAENGKVMIEKRCAEHGYFKDVYWSDVELFLKAERFAYDGIGVENPRIVNAKVCPNECGLCNLHLSHTALANVDLTNRCNLRCPICFANAATAGYVYEPTFEQILGMLKTLRDNRPIPCPAVQFSGGEPTIHPDFFRILESARELGFSQVQIATNGILLGNNPDFAQRCSDAGLNTVYLQFDGFDDEAYKATRGKALLETKLKAIENCRNVKPSPLGIVLVPTVVNTINDDQVGEIVKFAVENREVIRGVNFQPVAFTGRISQEERESQRFTLTDLVDRLVKQTDFLEKSDFYPVPCVTPFSELLSVIDRDPKVTFTSHPHCGLATYLFVENGNVTPITRFIDVEGFLKDAYKLAKELEGSNVSKIRALWRSRRLLDYIDKSKAPKGFDTVSIIRNIMRMRDKKSLRELHWKTVFVGAMHFQDNYNYDIERVRRCVIHYAVPDGRIIPFCAYNGGPCYREEIERKYSVPLSEYKER